MTNDELLQMKQESLRYVNSPEYQLTRSNQQTQGQPSQPSTGGRIIDASPTDDETLTAGGDTKGNGFFGTLKDSFDAGALNMISGDVRFLADTFNAEWLNNMFGNTDSNGKAQKNALAQSLDDAADYLKQRAEYNTTDQAVLDNDKSLWFANAIGNAAGSSVPTMVAYAALTAATGGAGGFLAGATRAGQAATALKGVKLAETVGGLAEGAKAADVAMGGFKSFNTLKNYLGALNQTGLGRVQLARMIGNVPEAMSESGAAIEEANKLHQEGFDRAVSKWGTLAGNVAWLTATDALGNFGENQVAKAMSKQLAKKGTESATREAIERMLLNPADTSWKAAGARALAFAPVHAPKEGAEEFGQNWIKDYATGQPFNSAQAWEEAKSGAIGGLFLGGAGGVMSTKFGDNHREFKVGNDFYSVGNPTIVDGMQVTPYAINGEEVDDRTFYSSLNKHIQDGDKLIATGYNDNDKMTPATETDVQGNEVAQKADEAYLGLDPETAKKYSAAIRGLEQSADGAQYSDLIYNDNPTRQEINEAINAWENMPNEKKGQRSIKDINRARLDARQAASTQAAKDIDDMQVAAMNAANQAEGITQEEREEQEITQTAREQDEAEAKKRGIESEFYQENVKWINSKECTLPKETISRLKEVIAKDEYPQSMKEQIINGEARSAKRYATFKNVKGKTRKEDFAEKKAAKQQAEAVQPNVQTTQTVEATAGEQQAAQEAVERGEHGFAKTLPNAVKASPNITKTTQYVNYTLKNGVNAKISKGKNGWSVSASVKDGDTVKHNKQQVGTFTRGEKKGQAKFEAPRFNTAQEAEEYANSLTAENITLPAGHHATINKEALVAEQKTAPVQEKAQEAKQEVKQETKQAPQKKGGVKFNFNADLSGHEDGATSFDYVTDDGTRFITATKLDGSDEYHVEYGIIGKGNKRTVDEEESTIVHSEEEFKELRSKYESLLNGLGSEETTEENAAETEEKAEETKEEVKEEPKEETKEEPKAEKKEATVKDIPVADQYGVGRIIPLMTDNDDANAVLENIGHSYTNADTIAGLSFADNLRVFKGMVAKLLKTGIKVHVRQEELVEQLKKDGHENAKIDDEGFASYEDNGKHTIYAYTGSNGELYFDLFNFKLDTAAHEYTHVWWQMMEKGTPEQRKVIKECTDFVKKTRMYEDIMASGKYSPDVAAQEAYCRILGYYSLQGIGGKEKQAEFENRILGKQAQKSTFRRLFDKFFNTLRRMFGLKVNTQKAEGLQAQLDLTMKDLLEGKNPLEQFKVNDKEVADVDKLFREADVLGKNNDTQETTEAKTEQATEQEDVVVDEAEDNVTAEDVLDDMLADADVFEDNEFTPVASEETVGEALLAKAPSLTTAQRKTVKDIFTQPSETIKSVSKCNTLMDVLENISSQRYDTKKKVKPLVNDKEFMDNLKDNIRKMMAEPEFAKYVPEGRSDRTRVDNNKLATCAKMYIDWYAKKKLKRKSVSQVPNVMPESNQVQGVKPVTDIEAGKVYKPAVKESVSSKPDVKPVPNSDIVFGDEDNVKDMVMTRRKYNGADDVTELESYKPYSDKELAEKQARVIAFFEKYWVTSDNQASLQTNGAGFGKTYVCTILMKRILSVNPDAKILVCVKTDPTAKSWRDAMKSSNANRDISFKDCSTDGFNYEEGKVSICKYQSINKKEIQDTKWDYIFFDESQNISSSEDGASVNKPRFGAYAKLVGLDGASDNHPKVHFLSATPAANFDNLQTYGILFNNDWANFADDVMKAIEEHHPEMVANHKFEGFEDFLKWCWGVDNHMTDEEKAKVRAAQKTIANIEKRAKQRSELQQAKAVADRAQQRIKVLESTREDDLDRVNKFCNGDVGVYETFLSEVSKFNDNDLSRPNLKVYKVSHFHNSAKRYNIWHAHVREWENRHTVAGVSGFKSFKDAMHYLIDNVKPAHDHLEEYDELKKQQTEYDKAFKKFADVSSDYNDEDIALGQKYLQKMQGEDDKIKLAKVELSLQDINDILDGEISLYKPKADADNKKQAVWNLVNYIDKTNDDFFVAAPKEQKQMIRDALQKVQELPNRIVGAISDKDVADMAAAQLELLAWQERQNEIKLNASVRDALTSGADINNRQLDALMRMADRATAIHDTLEKMHVLEGQTSTTSADAAFAFDKVGFDNVNSAGAYDAFMRVVGENGGLKQALMSAQAVDVVDGVISSKTSRDEDTTISSHIGSDYRQVLEIFKLRAACNAIVHRLAKNPKSREQFLIAVKFTQPLKRNIFDLNDNELWNLAFVQYKAEHEHDYNVMNADAIATIANRVRKSNTEVRDIVNRAKRRDETLTSEERKIARDVNTELRDALRDNNEISRGYDKLRRDYNNWKKTKEAQSFLYEVNAFVGKTPEEIAKQVLGSQLSKLTVAINGKVDAKTKQNKPVSDRDQVINMFQTGEARIAICGLDSVAEGVSLDDQRKNGANRYMFVCGIPDNVFMAEQLVKRIMRQGTKSNSVVHFLTKGTETEVAAYTKFMLRSIIMNALSLGDNAGNVSTRIYKGIVEATNATPKNSAAELDHMPTDNALMTGFNAETSNMTRDELYDTLKNSRTIRGMASGKIDAERRNTTKKAMLKQTQAAANARITYKEKGIDAAVNAMLTAEVERYDENHKLRAVNPFFQTSDLKQKIKNLTPTQKRSLRDWLDYGFYMFKKSNVYYVIPKHTPTSTKISAAEAEVLRVLGHLYQTDVPVGMSHLERIAYATPAADFIARSTDEDLRELLTEIAKASRPTLQLKKGSWQWKPKDKDKLRGWKGRDHLTSEEAADAEYVISFNPNGMVKKGTEKDQQAVGFNSLLERAATGEILTPEVASDEKKAAAKTFDSLDCLSDMTKNQDSFAQRNGDIRKILSQEKDGSYCWEEYAAAVAYETEQYKEKGDEYEGANYGEDTITEYEPQEVKLLKGNKTVTETLYPTEPLFKNSGFSNWVERWGLEEDIDILDIFVMDCEWQTGYTEGIKAGAKDSESIKEQIKKMDELYKQRLDSVYGPKPKPRLEDMASASISDEDLAEVKRSKEEITKEVLEMFPKGTSIKENALGSTIITAPNGAVICLDYQNKRIVNAKIRKAVAKAHGFDENSEFVIEGSWRALDRGGLNGWINISGQSRKGTGYHEVAHAVRELCLTKAENAALDRHIDILRSINKKYRNVDAEEIIADLVKQRKSNGKSVLGRIVNKIKDFVGKLESLFTGMENVYKVTDRIASGEVWNNELHPVDETKTTTHYQAVRVPKQYTNALDNLRRNGMSAKDIFVSQGAWRDVDGVWKTWINDLTKKVSYDFIQHPNTRKVYKLSEIYDNEDLYKMCPFLRDAPVRLARLDPDVWGEEQLDEGITLNVRLFNENLENLEMNTPRFNIKNGEIHTSRVAVHKYMSGFDSPAVREKLGEKLFNDFATAKDKETFLELVPKVRKALGQVSEKDETAVGRLHKFIEEYAPDMSHEAQERVRTMVANTLFHETQHYIQDSLGFARGGSTSKALSVVMQTIEFINGERRLEHLDTYISKFKGDLKKLTNGTQEQKDKLKGWYGKNDEESKEILQKLIADAEDLRNQLNENLDTLETIRRKVRSNKALYRALHGEQESRRAEVKFHQMSKDEMYQELAETYLDKSELADKARLLSDFEMLDDDMIRQLDVVLHNRTDNLLETVVPLRDTIEGTSAKQKAFLDYLDSEMRADVQGFITQNLSLFNYINTGASATETTKAKHDGEQGNTETAPVMSDSQKTLVDEQLQNFYQWWSPPSTRYEDEIKYLDEWTTTPIAKPAPKVQAAASESTDRVNGAVVSMEGETLKDKAGNVVKHPVTEARAAKKTFYLTMVDKLDDLHKLDEFVTENISRKIALGGGIYEAAQGSAANATGVTFSLVQGSAKNIRHLNKAWTMDEAEIWQRRDVTNPKTGNKYKKLVKTKVDLTLDEKGTVKQVMEAFKKASKTAEGKRFVELYGKDKNGKPSVAVAAGRYLAMVKLHEQESLFQDSYLVRVATAQRHHKTIPLKSDPFKMPNGLTIQDVRECLEAAGWKFNKTTGPNGQVIRTAITTVTDPNTINQHTQVLGRDGDIFHEANECYRAVNRNVNNIMCASGCMSVEMRDFLQKKYPDYCPLIRDFSDTAAADNLYTSLSNGGSGMANVKSILNRISIEGSKRPIVNPLEASTKAIAVAANRAVRNRVAMKAVDLIDEAAKNGSIPYDARPIRQLPERFTERKNALGKTVKIHQDEAADPKNCIFTVMKDGQRYAFKCDPELYQPIIGYNEEQVEGLMKFATGCAQALRIGSTMSPSFIIRNFLRDTVFAGVSSENGFVPILDSLKGLHKLITDEDFRAEFEAAGIGQFNYYNDMSLAKKNLDDVVKDGETYRQLFKEGKIWRMLGRFGMTPIRWSMEASELAESSTRAGEYMRAKKNAMSGKTTGTVMSEAEATAYASVCARTVTLDFTRNGTQGRKYNRYVPFFNAAIQGTDKMATLIANPKTRWRTFFNIARYILAPTLLFWIMQMSDDPEKRKKLNAGIKYSNWLIPVSDDLTLKIPKPQEAGVTFGSLLEAALDTLYLEDPNAMSKWMSEAWKVLWPEVVPTAFLPMLEWESNYNFFMGKPVVANRLSVLNKELQYTPTTTTTSKLLARGMKDVGLDPLSPLKVDNAIRNVFGTMGYLFWDLASIVSPAYWQKPDKEIKEQYPFRDFAVTDANMSADVTDFYTMSVRANTEYNSTRDNKKLVSHVTKYGKHIAQWNAQIRDIDEGKKAKNGTDYSKWTPEKKQEAIKVLNKKIRDEAKTAVDIAKKRYGYKP